MKNLISNQVDVDPDRAGEKLLDTVTPKTRLQAEALLQIVPCLLDANGSCSWTSYSRDRGWYSGRQRYHGPAFTYRAVIGAIDSLADAGLIIEQRTKPGSHRTVRSRMRPTHALSELMAGIGIELVVREVLKMRAADGELMDYVETDETMRLRHEVRAVNEFLGSINIELNHSDIQKWGNRLRIGARIMPWSDTPQVHRGFCRGSWDLGGRLYGSFQLLPKELRRALTIDCEPVAQLDYKALYPTIIYNIAAMPLPPEPYHADGFTRAEAKLAVAVGINAKSPNAAVRAIACKLTDNLHPNNAELNRARRLFDAITELHDDAGGLLGTDQGVKLQFLDSKIMLGALEQCKRSGIPALPVHDELIVPVKHVSRVSEIMEAAFAGVVPGPNPARIDVHLPRPHA